MSVFLSWAGDQSHAVAKAFRDWLPRVIQISDPWLSSVDIQKGASWPDDLQEALKSSNGVGIFFVNAEALKSQWLLFEAGRVASLGAKRVCVVRIGLDRVDPPLGLYQSTGLTQDDVRKLILDLNQILQARIDAQNLVRVFDWAWPQLEAELTKALAIAAKVTAPVSTATPAPEVDLVLRAIDRVEARIGGLETRLAGTERAVHQVMHPVSGYVGSPSGSLGLNLGIPTIGLLDASASSPSSIDTSIGPLTPTGFGLPIGSVGGLLGPNPVEIEKPAKGRKG